MKYIKLILTVIIINLSLSNFTFADIPHFIDFSKVLNQSEAGKKAQIFLKKKYENDLKKFSTLEKNLRDEETKLISQKKMVTSEEYQKKIKSLRSKVADYQKEKKKSLQSTANLRAKAKQQLLTALNPVIKKYMEENKIRLVLDKKSILLGDTNLEITSQIITELNKKIKSLNLK